ncbi:MAG TPA: hypothetical protein DCE55_09850 [Planctomycetaceae bacterium]|nr:hypothetical protein [Planctomycetaceae bacterium]
MNRLRAVPPMVLAWCVWLVLPLQAEKATVVEVQIDPPAISLQGPAARHTLLVTGTTTSGRLQDLGDIASFRSTSPNIVSVDQRGVARPVSDGQGTIIVEVSGRELTVPVTVTNSASPREFSFVNDVMPLLDKFGCNGAGCHGKAEGQAGFKLSVFNSDPMADYHAIVHQSRGRRVFRAAPEQSLLLLKASGTKPHGGGVRIPPSMPEYGTLRDWLAAGAPYGNDAEATVTRITVTPGKRVLTTHSRQQLRVMAFYTDGRIRDVTRLAQYESNNPGLASINDFGLVTTLDRPGQVALRAGFMNQFAMFQGLIPHGETINQYPELPEHNFIDGLVYSKLRDLNILPSEQADDAEYARRVYLDVIGTLPSAAEVQHFLSDPSSDRRAQLVERLLQRPEYADYWALKWSDLLGVQRKALGHKAAYAYYRWIRENFAANRPYDEFVREIITAQGALLDVPQANFYKVDSDPGKLASRVAQTFLGLRIECAQCHHHPTDVWTQTDYFGMQSFFTQVKKRGTPRGEVLWTEGNPETKHPRSGEVVQPHPLGTEMPDEIDSGDRRRILATWLSDPTNPWFAKNLANRVWAHFMGRGLIEPVDDLRATNPATNPELLAALSQRFIDSKYDIRELIRTITRSRIYQLSSTANASNRLDEQNYSHALLRPLEAEVLLDAVSQATGIAEKFDGVPTGYRAIQLWDSGVSHYFLKLFGRPLRTSACVCERIDEPNVAQALHLMNSPDIHQKLKHEGGTLARLVKQHQDDENLVHAIYLTFFSRPPFPEEATRALEYLQQASDRRTASEDLAWSMLCSIEFIFRH